jgi:hypothetical protein
MCTAGNYIYINTNIMFLDIINCPVLYPISGRPEIGASSIDWAQKSRFYLKTETESSFPHAVFFKYKEDGVLDKSRTMGHVQKHNICTNVISSQTFRSYLYTRSYEVGITTPATHFVAERTFPLNKKICVIKCL